MKASEYIKDFAAGIDPTGVATFTLASKRKTDKHGLHKAINVAGGGLGGYALGAIMPAAILGVGAGLFSKNRGLAKSLTEAAKGSVDILRPEKVYKYIRHGTRHIKENHGRVMSALTTAPVALASGVLSGTSSKLQYDASLKQRKRSGDK